MEYLLQAVRRLRSDDRGAVAMLFALSIVPLALLVGAAIEYSRASDHRTRLTNAADAAALSGVLAAQTALQSAINPSSPETIAKAQQSGAAAALSHFNSMVSGAGAVVNLKATPTVAVVGSTVTASMAFTGDVPMTFGKLFGRDAINIGNTVVANSGAGGGGQYLDVHIVMDNSASMGVGATLADINAMLADPKMFPPDATGCAFACHIAHEGGPPYATDDYAASVGYTLRIDVLKSAVQSVLSLANSKKTANDQFQFSLYTFANRLRPLGPASTDYAALSALVNDVRLTQIDGGTNFSSTIGKDLANNLPAASGRGTGPGDRKTVVIIVTDGVENSLDRLHSDEAYTATSPATVVDWRPTEVWRHYLDANFVLFPNWNYTAASGATVKATYYDGGDFKVQAMNPAICDNLKSRGATVGLVYVVPTAPAATYSGAQASIFAFITNSIQAGASATLEKCASSSNFYTSANSPTEIASAMTSLFQKFATSSVRLTR